MSHILIDRSLQYIEGTQRVLDEGATLENTQPHLKRIGVTRIASITELDRIGIPVFSAKSLKKVTIWLGLSSVLVVSNCSSGISKTIENPELVPKSRVSKKSNHSLRG